MPAMLPAWRLRPLALRRLTKLTAHTVLRIGRNTCLDLGEIGISVCCIGGHGLSDFFGTLVSNGGTAGVQRG